MKTYAFIFARGGSKGLPGKNIRLLGGKPLLAWSIEVAKEIPEIDSIFVSTDDSYHPWKQIYCRFLEFPWQLQ